MALYILLFANRQQVRLTHCSQNQSFGILYHTFLQFKQTDSVRQNPNSNIIKSIITLPAIYHFAKLNF